MSQLPFKAYSGEEPFVFISYAHKDSGNVFPLIDQLNKKGYRIWYDEGIDPGSEWPETIAQHLINATAVILFVSPNSMDSENVRREVTFALNHRKLLISVYLQPTEMSAGMSLQLGLNQAIHLYTYSTDNEFFEKLVPSMPEITVDYLLQESSKTEPEVVIQVHPDSAPTQEIKKIDIPDKIEPTIIQTQVQAKPLAEFTSFGMVLPFMPKGKATLTLKNGGETSCPLNCFVVPQNNGNYDGICVNKTLNGDEQYFAGVPGNGYRFVDMISMEATPGEEHGRIQLLINLANGERRFFEDIPQFEVGGLFGRSFKRFPISEISKITFENNCMVDDISDLALITTTDGISFYSPLGMLETMQFTVSIAGGAYTRYGGIRTSDAIVEYRKLTSIEIDYSLGGIKSDQYALTYTMRSGMSERLEPTDYYTPALSGINQYGCFVLPFRKITRIEVYTGGREGAPMPTPLPDINWPNPENSVMSFFGEGLATITDAANNKYSAPANAVFGIVGHTTCALYEGITTNLSEERVFELFALSDVTDFVDIEKIDLDYIEGSDSDYNLSIKDSSGFVATGMYSQSDRNAFPGIVFPNGETKGSVRIFALRSIEFDHYADAPEVEQAVVYTKSGKAIGVPRGSVVFSGVGRTAFPGCCLELPTGNSISIDSLHRIMICDQPSGDDITQWIVFECEELRGAFPMSSDMQKDYRLFAASEFGLCNLRPGHEWYLLDMKRTRENY